eukprot:1158392-Pelagomonas_calceolata.AAC.12
MVHGITQTSLCRLPPGGQAGPGEGHLLSQRSANCQTWGIALHRGVEFGRAPMRRPGRARAGHLRGWLWATWKQ